MVVVVFLVIRPSNTDETEQADGGSGRADAYGLDDARTAAKMVLEHVHAAPAPPPFQTRKVLFSDDIHRQTDGDASAERERERAGAGGLRTFSGIKPNRAEMVKWIPLLSFPAQASPNYPFPALPVQK